MKLSDIVRFVGLCFSSACLILCIALLAEPDTNLPMSITGLVLATLGLVFVVMAVGMEDTEFDKVVTDDQTIRYRRMKRALRKSFRWHNRHEQIDDDYIKATRSVFVASAVNIGINPYDANEDFLEVKNKYDRWWRV